MIIDKRLTTIEVKPELNLEKIIAESREAAQALNEFADKLERIEKKHADLCEMEKGNDNAEI
jgi:hypothetical protein